MHMRVWLNGRLMPVRQAQVSVLDHGLTVGDGVFETLKVVRGTPFAPTRHILRLRRSAAAIGLDGPDPDLVAAAMADAIAANRDEIGDTGRLRVTYTSGPGPSGSDRGPGPSTLIVLATAAMPWPESADVVTVHWPRNERGALAGVKTTSYGENAMALAAAKRAGASEAIFGNTRGELCEGTGSNVFAIFDGEVLTPPLSSGCLAGITRELVLQWFGARAETLMLADLSRADEVFITSSTRDVQPVSRVDGRATGGTRLGRELAAAFAARSKRDLDP